MASWMALYWRGGGPNNRPREMAEYTYLWNRRTTDNCVAQYDGRNSGMKDN
jgi:hypothetical protein